MTRLVVHHQSFGLNVALRGQRHLSNLAWAAVAVAVLALGSGCGSEEKASPKKPNFDAKPAAKAEELLAQRTKEPLEAPDPLAAFWETVPRGAVTLLAQPMITPRPEKLLTEQVIVQAVHDGTRLALRVVWEDSEESQGGHLAEYSDAVALQFPSDGSANTPVMMGAKGLPVHILHWRSQYQLDEEQGKPEMSKLYPFGTTDAYAMDFKEAKGGTTEEKESFLPARALGNPQAYRKKAVDEITAEGFGTSSVIEPGGAIGKGAFDGERWAVVFVRPLDAPGRSTLKVDAVNQVAFAVWQGGSGEVGSRKAVMLSWLPLRLQ
jgi:hypothetical protein